MKTNLFRRICLLLLLSILLTTFASCKWIHPKDEIETGAPTTTTPQDEQIDPAAITYFSTEMISQFKIVYANGAPTSITKEADDLKAIIKKTYGVELTVSSDYIRNGSDIFCEIPNEILIGETSREADDEYYASIGYEDYGYTIANGKIIIGGAYPETTIKALSDFMYNIVMLKKGGDQTFFCSDYSMAYKHTYDVSEIKLNGVSIREYQIVYPERGTLFEQQAAIHISTNLQQMTGFWIPIVGDKVAYTGKYEILVGKTNRSEAETLYSTATNGMNGCVAGCEKFIVAYGSSAQGIVSAVTSLVNRVKANVGDDQKADVTFSAAEVVAPTTSFATMTYNIYAGDVTQERRDQIAEMILRYMPDVFGVQEATTIWMHNLKTVFSEYYDTVGKGRNGGSSGEHCAIFYSKDRFELLKSDTKWLTETPDEISKLNDSQYNRIFTYALLKDRVTEETFVFVNTHLDFAAAQDQQVEILLKLLRECELEDYPVVITGDMNAQITSTAMKKIQSVGFASTHTISQTIDGVPGIDFIFVTEDCINAFYTRVCNESIKGGKPSDHAPIFAQIEIVISESGVNHDFRPLNSFPSGWLEEKRDTDESFGELYPPPTVCPTSSNQSSGEA